MEGNASEQQNVNTAVIVDDVKAPIGIDLGDIRVRWRSFLPGRPTIWHRATLSHLVYTHVTAEKRLADMQAALHAAGEDLGNAKRNLQNDQEASANIIRQMRSEIDELKRRNENQAAMIHAYWTRQASTEHDYQKLVNKLADAEQRIAGMEADLAVIHEDEAEGDQILGDRVEFEDVDTYSELATEAVRLADEVQDLKARQSKGAVWLVIDEETTLAAEEKARRLESSLREVTTERDKLRGELEVERMRLTACDVAARANTRESAAKALKGVPLEYRSPAVDSVVRAVEREMNWRERAKKLEGELILERLKSDMERTRARLAEDMAFCARNPPPQTPVTATSPLDERFKRAFPNSIMKPPGTPAGHPYTVGITEFIRRCLAMRGR